MTAATTPIQGPEYRSLEALPETRGCEPGDSVLPALVSAFQNRKGDWVIM